MFTKENTEIADFARHVMVGGSMVVRLYSAIKDKHPMHLDSDSEFWVFSEHTYDEIQSSENTIHLSRPQSDIDALFKDTHHWVTGYAKVGNSQRACWVNSESYMYLGGCELFYYGCEDNFVKEQFTIIATRPVNNDSRRWPMPEVLDLTTGPIEQTAPDLLVYWDGKQDLEVGMVYEAPGKNHFSYVGYHAGIVIGRPLYLPSGNNYLMTSDRSFIKPIDQRTNDEKSIDSITHNLRGLRTSYDLFAAIKAGEVTGIEYTGK